ncbi:MAG: hypothetical protein RLZZ584_1692 [Pseudomonadota bacterium]|jgi:tetratricopeptide (TPR) repeat protein
MTRWLIVVTMLCTACAGVLGGCAPLQRLPDPQPLLADAAFDTHGVEVDASQVLAMSPAMERYLRVDIARELRQLGPRDGLIRALYTSGQLRLDYDATYTRNAAEAFEARSGNCLSLVVMTAALARHLGLPVTFQLVSTEEVWTRSGDLVLDNAHINISLARHAAESRHRIDTASSVVIDFLPQAALEHQRAHQVDEASVIAMFMNNRAAEALALGRLDVAYAWSRAALLHAPHFIGSYATLGVIYTRRGLRAQAEAVYRHVLAHDGRHVVAMSNLARLLAQQGRDEEAALWTRRLVQLEPRAPFQDFMLGRQAYSAGDYARARSLFVRELERSPGYHEVHFWLAVTDYALGDVGAARMQLELAVQASHTSGERALYAGKLARLRAVEAHP